MEIILRHIEVTDLFKTDITSLYEKFVRQFSRNFFCVDDNIFSKRRISNPNVIILLES